MQVYHSDAVIDEVIMEIDIAWGEVLMHAPDRHWKADPSAVVSLGWRC